MDKADLEAPPATTPPLPERGHHAWLRGPVVPPPGGGSTRDPPLLLLLLPSSLGLKGTAEGTTGFASFPGWSPNLTRRDPAGRQNRKQRNLTRWLNWAGESNLQHQGPD